MSPARAVHQNGKLGRCEEGIAVLAHTPEDTAERQCLESRPRSDKLSSALPNTGSWRDGGRDGTWCGTCSFSDKRDLSRELESTTSIEGAFICRTGRPRYRQITGKER
jgi:hypothetical protein